VRCLPAVALSLALLPAVSSAQAPAVSPPQVAFPGQYAAPPADRKYPAWPKGCTRFEGEERMTCLDVVASDFGGLYRYAAANAALAAPKPGEARVVFFGENVPAVVSEAAFAMLREADALLVAGSSLAVYSGFRFVLRAGREGKPVAIVTMGPTRGDSHAAARADAPLGEALPCLADFLLG